MIYLQFLIGFILYVGMAIASYHAGIKASAWYFPLGMVASAIVTSIWFHIAKHTPNSSELIMKGLFWDVMLTSAYLIVPLLFFHARFTTTQAIGVGLVLAGLILTKV